LISLKEACYFLKRKEEGEKGAWEKGKGEHEERMRGDCSRVVLYERRINKKNNLYLEKLKLRSSLTRIAQFVEMKNQGQENILTCFCLIWLCSCRL